MLAAAEGRTSETRGRIDPKIVAERVAGIGPLRSLVTCC
jgi:hypothetical protein